MDEDEPLNPRKVPQSVRAVLASTLPEGDLAKIVQSMSKLRSQVISNKALTDTEKDAYLNMACKLADGIIKTGNESALRNRETLKKIIAKTPELMTYDAMQHDYWKNKNSQFAVSLDNILIATLKDDFCDLDARHHIFQAIKCMTVEGVHFQEQEKVYNTVLPFQKPIEITGAGQKVKSFAAYFLGSNYAAETVENGLTLKIDSSKETFDMELVNFAKSRGYSYLLVDMKSDDYEKLAKQIKNANSQNTRAQDGNQFLRKTMAKGIGCTKMISYPFLGMLPRRLQERLEAVIGSDNYDAKFAFLYSGWTQTVGGAAAAIATAAISATPILGDAFVPVAIDGIARVIIGSKANQYGDGLVCDHTVGSVFLKPVFWPVEKYFETEDKIKIVTLRIPLREEAINQTSPAEFYKTISKLEVPSEEEASLVWGPSNHHSFGRKFIDYVNKKVEAPKGITLTQLIDKENQNVSFSYELAVENYRKNVALMCYNGKRYIVTTIRKAGKDINFVESVSKVLGIEALKSNNPPRVEKIKNDINAVYVHMVEYSFGQLTDSVEALN